MRSFNLIQPRLNYAFLLRNIIYAFKSIFLRNNQFKINKLSDILGTNEILFFNSGHSALQFFLEQLPPRTRVAVQPLTCPTVFESIKNANCEIVFIDINLQLVIDEKSLRENTDKFDVIILTHTFGFPVDVLSLKNLMADKIIIEDCAHAFLTKYQNTIVGKTGNVAFFSHGFAKFPSVFNGGFLMFNDNQFFEDSVRLYSKLPKPQIIETLKIVLKSVVLSISNNKLIYTVLTKKIKQKRNQNFVYKYNPDNKVKQNYSLSLSLLDFELSKIEDYLSVQHKNAKKIFDTIQNKSNIVTSQYYDQMNCFMLPAFVSNPEKFIELAEKNGIEIGRHFVQSKKIIETFGYIQGQCKNYEQIVNELITIPIHYNYTNKNIEKIIKTINQFAE